MNKVFGYLRVSTAEQATNGESLDTQRQQVAGYAMMKGWQVAEFFIEGGRSGLDAARRSAGGRGGCWPRSRPAT